MKEKATKESLALSHQLEAKQEGFLREGSISKTFVKLRKGNSLGQELG